MKKPRMNMSTPATPAGTTRATYLSGTNAPSSTVSSLRVARIPSTSQVSLIVTPFVPRGMNACTIFGAAGSLVSMRVHPEPRPDRGQAAEGLVSGEPPAPVDALGLRGREEPRDVVAVLGVARGEHLAGRRLLENPLAGLVAAPPEVGRVAHPVVVHVDAERGGGRVEGEPARLEAPPPRASGPPRRTPSGPP